MCIVICTCVQCTIVWMPKKTCFDNSPYSLLTSPYSKEYVTLLHLPGSFPAFLIGTNAMPSFSAIIGPKRNPRDSKPTMTWAPGAFFLTWSHMMSIRFPNCWGFRKTGKISLKRKEEEEITYQTIPPVTPTGNPSPPPPPRHGSKTFKHSNYSNLIKIVLRLGGIPKLNMSYHWISWHFISLWFGMVCP